MSDAAQLIAVDWGTTSFRAYLLAGDGRILDHSEQAKGILAVSGGRFAEVLQAAVGLWRAADQKLPILMCGMIGSRQGWIETPYVRCPADLKAIAARLTWVDAGDLGTIAVVPGLDTRDKANVPDVMRGEETKLLGAMQSANVRDGLFVMPGTHCKWATISGGAIAAFSTYMTGEMFAALKDHTILGRLMTPRSGGGHAAGQASAGFAKGLKAGHASGNAGDLLHRLFAVRTLGLVGDLPPPEIGDYLSGLLIGAELASATAGSRGPFTIIASPDLAQRYEAAAKVLGLKSAVAAPDIVVHGLMAIARAANLIKKA